MTVILQADVIQSVLIIAAAVIGFLSATAANFIKDFYDRYTIRNALYREIFSTFEALNSMISRLDKQIDQAKDYKGTEAFSAFRVLDVLMSAPAYKFVKTSSSLQFYQLKEEAEAIDSLYSLFHMFLDTFKHHQRPQKQGNEYERQKNELEKLEKLRHGITTFMPLLKPAVRGLDSKKLLKLCKNQEQFNRLFGE